jgi:two-component system cell cycle sensor histidine kinase/response regulator CckA
VIPQPPFRPSSTAGGAPRPLRILFVEDEPEDVELVAANLRRAGLDFEIAEIAGPSQLDAALAATPDVVLVDYRLRGWDGKLAITAIRERNPELPVVIVTGAVSEEVAVDCMKAGAVDYLLKDRLTRLGPAILGAVEAARVRRAHLDAEHQLERLFLAIEQTTDAIVVTDTRGTIEYVNPALERVTGWTRAELIGNSPRVFRSGVHPPLFYAELWDTLRRGDTWRGRFVNRRRDGSLFEEEATITPVRVGGSTITHFVGVKRDLSRELALEHQLARTQKLEAIGRLAGGIAHDFNNLLAIVLGQAELLATLLPRDGEASGRLEQIAAAANRGAKLTRQLLLFGRHQQGTVAPLDLDAAILALLELLRPLLGEHLEVRLQRSEGLPRIEADPAQVDQLVTNLVLNARDAMPGGGVIALETSAAEIDQSFVDRHPGSRTGPHVRLRVRDSGVGMNQETRERLFEPFFTTKPAGQGTGLGLATVWGIVQGARGFLTVESELGRGSTFDVYLPAIPAVAAPEPAPAPVPPPNKSREATVLVVEDQPLLRDLVLEVLARSGHRALAAGNGEEALALAAQQTIELLLTDVVMPGISGEALALQLSARYPQLRVLFMTGYADDSLRARLAARSATVLEKPFSIAKLSETVRAALGGPAFLEPDRRG